MARVEQKHTKSRDTRNENLFIRILYDRIIIVVIAFDFDERCHRRNVVQYLLFLFRVLPENLEEENKKE